MTITERQTIVDRLCNEVLGMAQTKGKSYASDKDSLSNFKRNAERLGLTKYQVWAIYFNKHVDAINNAIMNSPELPVDKSEDMRSRIVDAIVYLTLLECLLVEEIGGSK